MITDNRSGLIPARVDPLYRNAAWLGVGLRAD